MKVLQVAKFYYPLLGGVEKIVQQIAEGLNGKDDFKINVLCCIEKGKGKGKRKGKKEVINKVKVSKASSFGVFWGMPVSFSFLKLFKKLSKKVDLIDFHHPFPLGDLAIFLFSPKSKLIVHYHSDIVRQKFLKTLVKPFILHTLKRAQKIIVSNPNLIKSSSCLRKFQEKCSVIPFGVDLEKFKKYDREKVENLKMKYGDFVLFVGRLNYYKGVNYLIEAIENVEVNLVIIGEGKERQKLKKQVEQLNLKHKVFFLSPKPRKSLINFYKACKIFVLPSIFKSEAFGIVLIEAMACGKPVVSTELGTGTSWVNVDGKTGFVVQPRDSKALAHAIKKILGNKKLAQELSQNARERVKDKFSLEKMLRETKEVYRTI